MQCLLSGQIPLLFSTSGNDVLKRRFPMFPAEKLIPKDFKDFVYIYKVGSQRFQGFCVYIYIYKLNNIYVGKNEVYLIISLNKKKIIIIKKGRSRR